MTYQLEKFLTEQNHSYRKIRQFISQDRHSSDNAESESASQSSSDSENHRRNKRLKSHQH